MELTKQPKAGSLRSITLKESSTSQDTGVDPRAPLLAHQASRRARPCLHCGKAVPSGDPSEFCCRGCEAVYAILSERGLGEVYYRLKSSTPSVRGSSPAELPESNYAYLDDPTFLAQYAGSREARSMQFYLQGVHCVACVWLTEKVPEFLSTVKGVRLDLGTSVATVVLDPGGKFSEVAAEFARLGYRPIALKQGDAEMHQQRENRLQLIRLAVAGAATGNIMLMSVPLYTGLTGPFAELFKWLSFVIFLPVAFFCALPFYLSALSALRARQVSIDIPIVLGILIGGLASTYNLLTGSPHIYFDSLAPLVFLLLSSRFALKRAQQSAINSARMTRYLTPSWVNRLGSNGEFSQTALQSVNVGDLIRVQPHEIVPVDGVVTHGDSALNCALLTGESSPQVIGPDSAVFAGTANLHAPVVVRVSALGATSRLGQILKQMEDSLARKAPLVEAADRASRVFVGVVLVLVTGVFFWWLRVDFHEALNRALALAIVTCPCALALATPLAVTHTLGRCARAGILIKGGDVLERLTKIQNVFLDKTGTLTNGSFEVLHWKDSPSIAPSDDLAGIVLALESRSAHPIAHALQQFFSWRKKAGPLPEVSEFREALGRGVSAQVLGRNYEIRQWAESLVESSLPGGSHIAVFQDGRAIAWASLGDRLREDSVAAVNALRDLGLQVHLLSGDSISAVESAAKELAIEPQRTHASYGPEQKAAVVRSTSQSLMVGDGANDAVALAAAFAGIATHGGMEISLRAADAYHLTPGVQPVAKVIVAARETMRVIYRNFAFSIFYNLVGASAALLGWITPLTAAILMPASALTVFISSLRGTGRLRKIFS